jgi:hypothetical protein
VKLGIVQRGFQLLHAPPRRGPPARAFSRGSRSSCRAGRTHRNLRQRTMLCRGLQALCRSKPRGLVH